MKQIKQAIAILESNAHSKPRINTKDVVSLLKTAIGEEYNLKNPLLKLQFDPRPQILKLSALTIILRDLMEDMDFEHFAVESAEAFLFNLNKNAEFIASGGDESNKQLENIYTAIGIAIDGVVG